MSRVGVRGLGLASGHGDGDGEGMVWDGQGWDGDGGVGMGTGPTDELREVFLICPLGRLGPCKDFLLLKTLLSLPLV